MENIQHKYEKLALKATSSAFDYERGTIYSFLKYCKACGEGLNKPPPYARKTDRSLWKKSFCCEECKENGKRVGQQIKLKGTYFNFKKDYPVEEMAFLAIDIERAEKQLPPTLQIVLKADRLFNLLSEKLRFLEIETGETWYESKWYYWINQI